MDQIFTAPSVWESYKEPIAHAKKAGARQPLQN